MLQLGMYTASYVYLLHQTILPLRYPLEIWHSIGNSSSDNEQSQKFFALPESTKQKAPHPPGGFHHRGYSGLGVEKVSQNVFDEEDLKALRSVPDVKESFESGNVDDEMQPNIWLEEGELLGFRGYVFFQYTSFGEFGLGYVINGVCFVKRSAYLVGIGIWKASSRTVGGWYTRF